VRDRAVPDRAGHAIATPLSQGRATPRAADEPAPGRRPTPSIEIAEALYLTLDRPGPTTYALDRGRPVAGPSVTRTCGRDVSITTLQPVDISECELCALFSEDLLALIRSQA
jgi:hypothetical protein